MDAESSQPVRRPKRSNFVVSDSEGEDEVLVARSSPEHGIRRGKKRKSEEVVVDDEDLNDLNADDAGPERESHAGPSNGRARSGRARAEEEAEEEDDEDAQPNGHRATRNGHAGFGFRPEYQRGFDGYVAGSITRIKLVNFVTYDFVEFRPGPHLNMILGPNGTGKSTVAAGIAIGLGFHPRVMGRANDLKSYVKQGMEEAQTEIELKGRPGKRNPVIWRRFTREDDKSEWKLNGAAEEPATKKAIAELVLDFGVQANNLCSFLPQDKVAEFAKMAPDVVLQETMRAAGDPRLTDWHAELCKIDEAKKKIETSLGSEVAQRDLVQGQVDNLAGDVELYRRREEQELNRERLKAEVLFAEHNELSAAIIERNRARKAFQAKIAQLLGRRKPLEDLRKRYGLLVEKSETTRKKNEGDKEEVSKAWRRALRGIGEPITHSEEIDEKLTQFRKKAKRRDDEIRNFRESIKKADEILAKPIEGMEERRNTALERKRVAVATRREAEQAFKAADGSKKAHDAEISRINHELDRTQNELNRLSSIERRREDEATKLDPCIGWLIDYLNKHPEELKGAWSKPPMISVNVQDVRLAAQVEACTNLAQRKTFIFENQQDYDMVTERLQGRTVDNLNVWDPQGRRWFQTRRKLGFNLVVLEVTEEACNPPRICSSDKLRRVGMDGWAIDYVEAPPPVMAFLCQKANLHQAAVTARPGRDINYDSLTDLGITRWATATEMASASRSRYGQRHYQHNTTSLRPAVAFNVTVDHDAVKKVTEASANLKRQRQDLEKSDGGMEKDLQAASTWKQKASQEVTNCDEELTKLTKEREHHSKARADKESYERRLADALSQPSLEEAREKLRQEKYTTLKGCIPYLEAQTNAGDTALDLATSICETTLKQMQYKEDWGAIDNRANTGDEALQQIQEDRAAANVWIAEQQLITGGIKRKLEAMMGELGREVKHVIMATFSRDPKPTSAEKRDELAHAEEELAIGLGIDPGIVERHNRLTEQLKGLQNRVDKQQDALSGAKRRINKVLASFDPALDTLVGVVSEKFSAAFARIGCSGEVRVMRSETGFERWGIEILVSYRDSTPLAVLTGSRQSGGERSLATVTYLMSLSEMARTPFSLVDEINQGMDQRAERNVHNQLVGVTCGENAGQYFLITPKLLTNLNYHRKMKVLVVNNGAWVPDGTDKANRWGDLKGCLGRYRAAHPRGVAVH